MTEEEKKKQREEDDLRFVLNSPQGRRLYWKIMAECRAFTESFIENTNLAYYQKGRKSVGLDLFHDMLGACPEKFKQMQDENNSLQTREKIKLDRKIRNKKTYTIDSPSLPNTGAERVKEVVHG